MFQNLIYTLYVVLWINFIYFFSRIAEACKSQSLKFLDCGIGYQQGHVQAIYPGESALFDTIVDHEDLSEDAPHCVTKSFPYTIDHCISWAVRKTSSWKKTRPDPKEDLTIKAKAKFHQHFIKKPQILLDNFPPGESPETWKKPKRVPRTDVKLNFPENQLHAEVINALVQLFNFRLTDETEESEDEIEIPKDLENKLILALTKMRAFVYNIAADLEPDHALIRRARKIQHCQITVASLASALVLWELHKLEQSLESQDWWFSERNGFRILKSKTQLTMKTIGKLTLNPWENVQIQALCEWTLQDLLDQLEDKFGVLVEAVIQNGKSLFLKIMPTHVNKKRKP